MIGEAARAGTAFERAMELFRQRESKMVRAGRGMNVQCPGPMHKNGDRNPSLAVTPGARGVLLHCHAGCEVEDVLTAIGWSKADLFDTPRTTYVYPDRTVTRSYTADGRKTFRQAIERQGDRTHLYRLEKLGKVACGSTVYLVEGEKDVEVLEALGVTATTAPMGAANFDKCDVSPLYGLTVAAVVDNDDAGTTWGSQVKAALEGRCRLEFRRAAVGKDAADHVAAGLGVDDLVPCDSSPPFPGNTETLAPTWAPVDLRPYLDGTYQPVTPTLLTRTDGVSLLYAGHTHSLHGESESGKSFIAQALSAELVQAGRPVLYVDFESDAVSVTRRLLDLGASAAAILAHFEYRKPESRPSAPQEQAAWAGLLRQRFDLAVIDGVTDALGLHGFKTADNDELTKWSRAIPRPIAEQTGAAVVLVDHVTKDSESRGRFAIGGQAKMNGLTGAAYTVEIDQPLGRGLRGTVVLRVAKDRPGYVRGNSGPLRKTDRTQETARIVIDSTGAGIVVTVEPWRGADGPVSPHVFRPTHLMQEASEVIEASQGPISFRTLDDLVKGKRQYIMAALDALVTEGYIARADGPRNAKLHRSLRPYRESSDPLSDQYVSAGNTQAPLATVSVPRLKDGDRGTHTQPIPGTVGEQSGNSRQGADGTVGSQPVQCVACYLTFTPTRPGEAEERKHWNCVVSDGNFDWRSRPRAAS